jgi:hypothetical protein
MKIEKERILVDKETGEEFPANYFEIEERDANFHKIWLWHIIQALDLIGNQKIKILSYILENIDTGNQFIGSQRIIAEETETSIQTVTITMKMLQETDIIKMRQHGVYYVNPNAIFKGDNKKRMNILYRYHDIGKHSK